MPSGFYCLGDDGAVQIDENYFCMSLRAKGSSNGGVGWDYASAGQYTDIVVEGATYPLVAVHSIDCRTAIIGTSKVGNTWTFRVLAFPFPGGNWFFEYYVFDVPLNKPTNQAGFGFEVRNASGQIVWDSQQPIMPLVSLSAVQGLPAGRKYAYICASRIEANYDTIIDTFGEPYTFWNFEIDMCASTGSGVIQGSVTLAAGGTEGQTGPQPFSPGLSGGGIASPTLLVLDVTNL